MSVRWRLVQIPIVLSLFAFIAWQLDLSAIRRDLGEIEPWRIAAVVTLNLPVALLFTTRSHLVLRKLGHRIRPSLLLPVAVLGNVAGAITPGSVGEVLRADALSSHARVDARDGAALVLFERAMSMYLMTLGALAAAGATWLATAPAAVSIAASAAGLVAPFIAGRMFARLERVEVRGAGLLRRGLSRLQDLSGRLRLLLGDWRLVAAWSIQTVAIFALNTLQFWLLARGVSGSIRFEEAWIAFSLPTLIGVASLIPLGLGAFDGSVAAAFDRLGTTLEEGTVVAVVVRAAISLPMLALALTSYIYLARRLPRQEMQRPPAGPVAE